MKKRINLSNFFLVAISFVFVLCTACKTEDPVKPKQLPVLSTTAITKITHNTATAGGLITSDSGIEIFARGVCWSLKPNPTIQDNITKDAAGTGEFTSEISNLIADTTYYVRSYATNSDGTAYGLQVTFKTLVFFPVLNTTSITSISQSTALSGGNITVNGGSDIIARGVCWSTKAIPTIDDSKTTDGIGIGLFSSSITGLTAGTNYYVCAYATTSKGTVYGNVYQFTTTVFIANIATSIIPAGTFTMGSPVSEVDRDANEIQHTVSLNSFLMSKYEITNMQYAAFLNARRIGSNGLDVAGTFPTKVLIYVNNTWGVTYSDSQWKPVAGKETSPVVYVTWYGATEFATYVGGTLPTEAQWEYACRARTVTPFNTGAFLTDLQANYEWRYPYNGGVNKSSNGLGTTQQVGTYPANAFGLYDMHGNASEWCSDWYGNYPTLAQTNPTGAANGSCRLVRGGSWGGPWNCGAKLCRSAFRNSLSSDAANGTLGFRVVFVP